MSPYFYMHKGIGITWFVFLSVISFVISYIFIKVMGKRNEIGKEKLEDYFFLLIIVGFIGSRLFYVLLNIDLYLGSISYIFKLSHMNLSLIGGVIFSLIALLIISKRDNISFINLISYFTIPFYISMAIGIWSMYFDGMLIGKEYSGILSSYYLGANRHHVATYLSIAFIIGSIIEGIILYRIKGKKYSLILLPIVLASYYLIKIIFLY